MRTANAMLLSSLLIAGALVARPSEGGPPLADQVADLEAHITAVEAAIVRAGITAPPRPKPKELIAVFDALRDPAKAPPIPDKSSDALYQAKTVWAKAHMQAGVTRKTLYDFERGLPSKLSDSLRAQFIDILTVEVAKAQQAERAYADAGGK